MSKEFVEKKNLIANNNIIDDKELNFEIMIQKWIESNNLRRNNESFFHSITKHYKGKLDNISYIRSKLYKIECEYNGNNDNLVIIKEFLKNLSAKDDKENLDIIEEKTKMGLKEMLMCRMRRKKVNLDDKKRVSVLATALKAYYSPSVNINKVKLKKYISKNFPNADNNINGLVIFKVISDLSGYGLNPSENKIEEINKMLSNIFEDINCENRIIIMNSMLNLKEFELSNLNVIESVYRYTSEFGYVNALERLNDVVNEQPLIVRDRINISRLSCANLFNDINDNDVSIEKLFKYTNEANTKGIYKLLHNEKIISELENKKDSRDKFLQLFENIPSNIKNDKLLNDIIKPLKKIEEKKESSTINKRIWLIVEKVITIVIKILEKRLMKVISNYMKASVSSSEIGKDKSTITIQEISSKVENKELK